MLLWQRKTQQKNIVLRLISGEAAPALTQSDRRGFSLHAFLLLKKKKRKAPIWFMCHFIKIFYSSFHTWIFGCCLFFPQKFIKTKLFAGGRKEKNAVLISVPSNLDPKWASECFKIQNVGHQCGWFDRIVNQLLFIKQSINQPVFIEALNRAFQRAFPIKGETDVKHSAHV